MKKTVLTIGLILMTSMLKAAEGDLVTATLLDHVMPVTQFQNGTTKIALVDSIIQIGNSNDGSILDLQAGFSGDTRPEPGDPRGVNWIAGGFFKISTLLRGKLHLPEHWKFLNSLEYGPALFYDGRTKEWTGSYIQVGLAFTLNPK